MSSEAASSWQTGRRELWATRRSKTRGELSGSFRATQLGGRGALLISADSFTGLLGGLGLSPPCPELSSARLSLVSSPLTMGLVLLKGTSPRTYSLGLLSILPLLAILHPSLPRNSLGSLSTLALRPSEQVFRRRVTRPPRPWVVSGTRWILMSQQRLA